MSMEMKKKLKDIINFSICNKSGKQFKVYERYCNV